MADVCIKAVFKAFFIYESNTNPGTPEEVPQ